LVMFFMAVFLKSEPFWQRQMFISKGPVGQCLKKWRTL
jgi:hypothetical protein